MSGVLKETWSERLRYQGVIIDDRDYHVWGSSPVWGNDGKVHVFSARVPIATGFYKWWATSQIAHYVVDRPEGPCSLADVLLETGQTASGSWDCGTQHNPTITRIDDLYVLSYHSSMGTPEERKRSSARIGMMTAADINGPWKKQGIILETPTLKEVPLVPEGYDGGTDNPALIRHPDRVVNNPTYIEDPYVFVHDGLIYMLITDAESRGGLLLSSEDGLHFDYDEAAHGFGPVRDYVAPAELPETLPDMPQDCFERPQLLIKDGAPTHLYAPCGTNMNGGKGTCCYLFRIQGDDERRMHATRRW